MKYKCTKCEPEEAPCYLNMENGDMLNRSYCPSSGEFESYWEEVTEEDKENSEDKSDNIKQQCKHQQDEIVKLKAMLKAKRNKIIKLKSHKNILLDIILKNT